MNTRTHVTEESSPEVVSLACKAFPRYRGKKFTVQALTGSKRLSSAWDGGSRVDYMFISITSDEQYKVPDNGGIWFQNNGEICEISELPEGVALVQHVISRGKECGLDVFLNPKNFNISILPPHVELSMAERAVLLFTGRYKNSYGGETNLRYKYARKHVGIDQKLWLAAKEKLIERKLLRKDGGITPDGHNARMDDNEYTFKIEWDKVSYEVEFCDDWQQYTTWLLVDNVAMEDSEYYTPDKDDAIGTGRAMVNHHYTQELVNG